MLQGTFCKLVGMMKSLNIGNLYDKENVFKDAVLKPEGYSLVG